MQAMLFFPYLFLTLFMVCNAENDNDDRHQQDTYVDEYKSRRASYQHEQALLAAIYSPSRHYISSHEDYIQPSNFTYFTFNKPGIHRFILISLQGDADLYISTLHKHVSYDNYEISSCTCGIDEILIDTRTKRPVFIGIYGYSQYQISKYRLLIERVNSRSISIVNTDDSSNDDRNFHDAREQSKSSTDDQGSDVHEEESDNSRLTLWDIFVWLINFLLEVLG